MTSNDDRTTAPAPALLGPSNISPVPTDDEAVAIIAAVHAMWPSPVVIAEETTERDTAWKFSGRWWNRPLPSRRDRPYR